MYPKRPCKDLIKGRTVGKEQFDRQPIENIRDLLVSSPANTYLDLRDDPVKGIVIANVTETRVESSE